MNSRFLALLTLVAMSLIGAGCAGNDPVAPDGSAAGDPSATAIGPALPTTAPFDRGRAAYKRFVETLEQDMAGSAEAPEVLESLATPEVVSYFRRLYDNVGVDSIDLEPDPQEVLAIEDGVQILDCMTVTERKGQVEDKRFIRQTVLLVQTTNDKSWLVSSVDAADESGASGERSSCVPTPVLNRTTSQVERYLRAANEARQEPRFIFDGSELDNTTAGTARSTWLATVHQLIASDTTYETHEDFQISVDSFNTEHEYRALSVSICRRFTGSPALIASGRRVEISESEREIFEELLVWAEGPESGRVFDFRGLPVTTSCWSNK